MDPNTGELMSLLEAEKARAEGRRVVELIGSENDVRSISDAVKAQRRQQREAATTKRRKKNKVAKRSRKRNR